MDAERAKPLLVLLGVPLLLVGGVAVAIVLWLNRSVEEQVAWDRSSVVGGQVTLHYTGSLCDDGVQVEAEESAERVVLTVVTSREVDATCPAIGVDRQVTTTLDASLGDRALVDGAS